MWAILMFHELCKGNLSPEPKWGVEPASFRLPARPISWLASPKGIWLRHPPPPLFLFFYDRIGTVKDISVIYRISGQLIIIIVVSYPKTCRIAVIFAQSNGLIRDMRCIYNTQSYWDLSDHFQHGQQLSRFVQRFAGLDIHPQRKHRCRNDIFPWTTLQICTVWILWHFSWSWWVPKKRSDSVYL